MEPAHSAGADAPGDRVGRVTRVEGHDDYVDLNPALTETIAAKAGWTFMLKGGEDSYAISAAGIESVDDRIVAWGG